ncbi:MAG: hypothetical protein ACRD0P_01760 [Stackebrandtia sp.]
MNRADATMILEAIATEDAEIPADALARLGSEDTLAVVMSALVDAIDIKWEDGIEDDRLVTVFGAELRRVYPDVKVLKQAEDVTAVIKGGLGEYEFFDEVDPDDLFEIAKLVIRSVITERYFGRIELAEFCRGAIESAATDEDDEDDEDDDDEVEADNEDAEADRP